jgi:hypothetical protein
MSSVSGEVTGSAATFNAEAVLPGTTFEEITELRIRRPAVIELEAQRRKRRVRLARNGKLVLLAVDHPARGITQIRDEAMAMGDRHQLLARTRRLLMDPDLDGVVAASDLLEELLLLSFLERRSSGRSFLDQRLLVGTMNRGGLPGTVFEMDDGFTSLTAARLAELRCDGGKMLYRLDPADTGSGRTILACSRALNELRRHHLARFLEPLDVIHRGDCYDTQTDAATLIRQCGIAAALGESSSRLWLKLPYCEDFGRVGRATTVPILLLGGSARENPEHALRDFARGLTSSRRVRGAIIGRNLLFPGQADPFSMCRALTALVHRDTALEQALTLLREHGHDVNSEPKRRSRR